MTDYVITTQEGTVVDLSPVNNMPLTVDNFDSRILLESFVDVTRDIGMAEGVSFIGDVSTLSYDDLVRRSIQVLEAAKNSPEYMAKIGSAARAYELSQNYAARAAVSLSGSGAVASKFCADAAVADLQAARGIVANGANNSQAMQALANGMRGFGQLLSGLSVALEAWQAGSTQGALGAVFSGLIGAAAASFFAGVFGTATLAGGALIASLIGVGVLSYTAAKVAKSIWDNTPLGAVVDQALVDSGFWDLYFGFGEGVSDFMYDQYSRARSWVQALRDPLTLDLDGDGIETIGANGTVLFDHDGDGAKNGSGWIKSDDGLLVLDRNGNGTIDSGRELFGADTIKSNGQQASSGFEALKDLDSNNDNVFNASDAQFGNVRVWRDLNQDGISQSNELFTLASLNIKAINLVPTSTADVNLGNGNVIDNSGTFVRNDNSIGGTAEVLLARNLNYEFAEAA